MGNFNLNSAIALGALALQIAVTVITVTASAGDMKSDVAVLKSQLTTIDQRLSRLENRP